jgi:hypothetical protein
MSILKTKICRNCLCSFVPDIYCSGDYCKECSKIQFKSVEDEIIQRKFNNTNKKEVK